MNAFNQAPLGLCISFYIWIIFLQYGWLWVLRKCLPSKDHVTASLILKMKPFFFTFALVIYWRNRRRLFKKWWANQKALSFQFPGCCKAGCQGWCLFIALCWYRPYIWYFKPDLSTICLIIYLPFPNSADDVLEERQIWRLVLVGWNVMCLVVQKWCSQMRCWGTEFFRLFL